MKHKALFVGIDKYKYGIPSLSCAQNDANALLEYFLNHGYARNDVSILRNGKTNEILDALDEQTKRLMPGDFFLFFFAGHGYTIENNNGSLDRCLAGADDRDERIKMGKEGISLSEIRRFADNAKCTFVVILDACQTKIDRRRAVCNKPKEACNQRDLNAISSVVNRKRNDGKNIPFFVINSCSINEAAYEMEGELSQGLFTFSMLQTLMQMEKDGEIPTFDNELIKRIADKMGEYGGGYKQHPMFIPPDSYDRIDIPIFPTADGNPLSVDAPSYATPHSMGIAVPALVVCPVCGKKNRPEDTFRCQKCGRDNLCLRHQDEKTFLCAECAAKFEDEESDEGNDTSDIESANSTVCNDSYVTTEYVPRDEEKCKSWEFIRAAIDEIDGYDAFPHVLLGEDNLIDWSISTDNSALLLEVLPFSCDYDVVDEDVEPDAKEVSLAFISKLLRGKEFIDKQGTGTPVSIGVFASPTTINDIRSKLSESKHRRKFKDVHLEYLTCANFTYQVKRILGNQHTDAQSKFKDSAHDLYAQAENYYRGQNGVQEDRAKAFELYQKAAGQGHAEAQYSLGYMYANGESVAKDYDKAILWYGKAAAQGHQRAARFLEALRDRIRKDQEEERSRLYWEKKAEERKSHDAQARKEVSQRERDAQFRAEKERKDTEEKMAQAHRSYEEGNYSAAALLWRICAVRGVAAAQYNLGALYAIGKGVEQDYAQSIEWLQKGAAQRDEGSLKLLDTIKSRLQQGRQQLQNEKERLQSEKERLLNEKRRLEQQNASERDERRRLLQEQGTLLNTLGVRFYNGTQGQRQDYVKAVEHFKKAAEIGNVAAQFNLGVCYALGNGVAKNTSEAIRWYRKAAENGHDKAKEQLRKLGVR